MIERDDAAVLSILNPQFHCSDVGVEIGSCDASTVERERAIIRKYRTWLATQPHQVVASYEHWLSHFEYQCDEAEKAIAKGARQKWLKQRDESIAKHDETLRRARTYPKPD